MLFGREAATGLTIKPDGVEVFATPEDAADRLSVTGTALSRAAESHTILGEFQVPEGEAVTSTLTRTFTEDVRRAVPGIDENATIIHVDRDAAVLATPDGTAHTLPLRAHADAGATLATIARARGPTTAE